MLPEACYWVYPSPWAVNPEQVVNALPLPALDGGYLALLLIEALRGKKLDQVLIC
jgi:hypothetical protein